MKNKLTFLILVFAMLFVCGLAFAAEINSTSAMGGISQADVNKIKWPAAIIIVAILFYFLQKISAKLEEKKLSRMSPHERIRYKNEDIIAKIILILYIVFIFCGC